ncbi:MAG: hypothetical protein GY909_08395 [Oligoflexia bacterium]|nr:hypothetical protein [Oligoflexia bacterium]
MRLADERIRPQSLEEIKTLLQMGVLNPYEYVYSVEYREWVQPAFENNFQALGPFESTDEEFEKPEFHPPLFFPSQEITVTEREWSELNQRLENQEILIAQLQANSSEMEAENYEVKILELEETIQILNEKVSVTQSENEELKNKIIALESVQEESGFQNIESKQLEEEAAQLRSELHELKQKNVLALEENHKLAATIKKLGTRAKEQKTKIQKYQKVYKQEKKSNLVLKKNVQKLNKGIEVLKIKEKESQIALKDLEKFKQIQMKKEQEELERLIGDSFEVSNEPMWFIQLENEVKGPFKFEDMLSFKKWDKIQLETPVKKKGDKAWGTYKDTYEFTTNIIEKEVEDKGQMKKRFFIKRDNFRAPFYEVATLEIDGQDFRGHCTSISVGGCFFELPKLDLSQMKLGTQAVIKIKAGTLSEEIIAPVLIKNISESRPKGLGMQFQGLANRERAVILKFVDHYLNTNKAA